MCPDLVHGRWLLEKVPDPGSHGIQTIVHPGLEIEDGYLSLKVGRDLIPGCDDG